MTLGLVPVYLRYLGMEAYGLIGLLATLQATLSVLDLGLSTTLNRELARLSVQPEKAADARNLVRTLEAPYWILASLIAVVAVTLVPWLALNWLQAQTLPRETIWRAVATMGLITALQFPFALYSGGLLGLQRHVLLNIVICIVAVVRGVGAVLVLWLVSPTIEAFLLWQLTITAVQTVAGCCALWHSLPRSGVRPQFRREVLLEIWRFATGVTGISILATILLQIDRIVLSRILSLKLFGYYVLAATVASSFFVVVAPISSAVFPRLSQLVAKGDEDGLKKLYHQSCQLLAVLVLPAAIVLALFSREVLSLWTRDAQVAEHACLIVSLLVTGMAMGALLHIPYALQMAYGWTSLTFYLNLAAIVFLVPAMIWSTVHYGAAAAAATWIALFLGMILVGIHFMHKRLLKTEKRHWYLQDVILPLIGPATVGVLGRWLFPTQSSPVVQIICLASISTLALSASVLMTPTTADALRAWAHSSQPRTIADTSRKPEFKAHDL